MFPRLGKREALEPQESLLFEERSILGGGILRDTVHVPRGSSEAT